MSHRVYAVEHLDTFDNHDQYGYYKEMTDYEFNWRLGMGNMNQQDGRYYYGRLPDTQPQKSQQPYSASSESSQGFFATLFSNPGEKLKKLASIFFVLGCIGSIVLGIALGETDYYGEFNAGLFIVVLVGGIIISYISNLALAAFGDLVLNTQKIKEKLK